MCDFSQLSSFGLNQSKNYFYWSNYCCPLKYFMFYRFLINYKLIIYSKEYPAKITHVKNVKNLNNFRFLYFYIFSSSEKLFHVKFSIVCMGEIVHISGLTVQNFNALASIIRGEIVPYLCITYYGTPCIWKAI